MSAPQEPPESVVCTLYSEQLATMRTLQAHAFGTTLRVFALDLLIAGGLLTDVVTLAPAGKTLAALVLAGFHGVIFLYLREQAHAYGRRKKHLHVIEQHLRETSDLPPEVIKPPIQETGRTLFKGLRIYQVSVLLGALLALLAVLLPDLLT